MSIYLKVQNKLNYDLKFHIGSQIIQELIDAEKKKMKTLMNSTLPGPATHCFLMFLICYCASYRQNFPCLNQKNKREILLYLSPLVFLKLIGELRNRKRSLGEQGLACATHSLDNPGIFIIKSDTLPWTLNYSSNSFSSTKKSASKEY